ncbi:MAG: hypothetical protein IH830_05055 [Planctomycetes bacterium]|nr:hypothetical protein [Planctomycetota bacterium]
MIGGDPVLEQVLTPLPQVRDHIRRAGRLLLIGDVEVRTVDRKQERPQPLQVPQEQPGPGGVSPAVRGLDQLDGLVDELEHMSLRPADVAREERIDRRVRVVTPFVAAKPVSLHVQAQLVVFAERALLDGVSRARAERLRVL